jgi:aminodeoxyfutalosine deaminase
MPRLLLHSDAIADYRGVIASPGAILLDCNGIKAIGTPQEIGHVEDVPITQINGLVTPSFVNTHAHLDLSGKGNVAFEDSFIKWLVEVVKPIRVDTSQLNQDVQTGIELSIAGGCKVVGDIAGTVQAAEIVDASELISISFVEVIGNGARSDEAIEKAQALSSKFNLTPHAPYSCSKEVYKACFNSGEKIATHLSESIAEIEFSQNREGEFVKVMEQLGVWDETIEAYSQHPIEAILEIADEQHFVSAHLNYVDDCHLEMISKSNMSVAFCPRASAYFGHTGHRWEEMLEAGINVALGTDSLLCLDTPNRISVLDEMRLLYERDGGEPDVLFKMATVNGAEALGVAPSLVTLTEGETAGLLSFEGIDSLQTLMSSETAPVWVVPQEV